MITEEYFKQARNIMFSMVAVVGFSFFIMGVSDLIWFNVYKNIDDVGNYKSFLTYASIIFALTTILLKEFLQYIYELMTLDYKGKRLLDKTLLCIKVYLIYQVVVYNIRFLSLYLYRLIPKNTDCDKYLPHEISFMFSKKTTCNMIVDDIGDITYYLLHIFPSVFIALLVIKFIVFSIAYKGQKKGKLM